ncbi:MAG: phosphatase PAP2 family protein [Proteobacteria bacterium]|nr:phosphatase PAP2 family protein [Pseudomonadota bacterium]
MTSTVTTGLWQRFDHAEHALCLRVNRGCHHVTTRRLFVTISRLGDGIFWYVLMLAFALSGPQGAIVAAQMTVAGLAGTALYRQLKHRLVRERPFISYAGIQSGTAPLDRYSFPSGHTLHAVSFTLIATTHAPELALLLVPFALLVAASRVVLGLHYPTDVLAGAAIGATLARGLVSLWPV